MSEAILSRLSAKTKEPAASSSAAGSFFRAGSKQPFCLPNLLFAPILSQMPILEYPALKLRALPIEK